MATHESFGQAVGKILNPNAVDKGMQQPNLLKAIPQPAPKQEYTQSAVTKQATQ